MPISYDNCSNNTSQSSSSIGDVAYASQVMRARPMPSSINTKPTPVSHSGTIQAVQFSRTWMRPCSAPALAVTAACDGAADGRGASTRGVIDVSGGALRAGSMSRSEEHTSELQSRLHLVCRLLLEK